MGTLTVNLYLYLDLYIQGINLSGVPGPIFQIIDESTINRTGIENTVPSIAIINSECGLSINKMK